MQTTTSDVTPEQWRQFDELGFVSLGKVVPDGTLRRLCDRVDDIMLGKAPLDYSKIMMQLDSENGSYADVPEQTLGHKGRTLRYRKLQNLDYDPVFMEFIRAPLFDRVCQKVYGPRESIASFRTMFFNKPAPPKGRTFGGTPLPWHQDRWTHLDRDPLITVYTALDAATRETGCVEYIPGSHRLGVINPQHPSSFLRPEHVERHCPPQRVVPMELRAGETVLLHNWTLHRSGVNTSAGGAPRRALSVNYMLASTQLCGRGDARRRVGGRGGGHAEGGDDFPIIFRRAAAEARAPAPRL